MSSSRREPESALGTVSPEASAPPPEPEPAPVRRQWLKKSALLLGSLVVAFCALEAGFRIVQAVQERRLERAAERGETWAVYDEDLQYRLRGTDDNPLGLKNPPIGVKTPDRLRVLILGDSIPHGGEDVNDTLVAYAQKELDVPSGGPELINAGVPGYTTYQELVFLRKYGLGLEPDVVGVCFCVKDLHKILQFFKVRNGRIIGNTFDTTTSGKKPHECLCVPT